jgi:CDP-diacylglycerol--glycerol-3-phosphate 3-phosphatidyltransferase
VGLGKEKGREGAAGYGGSKKLWPTNGERTPTVGFKKVKFGIAGRGSAIIVEKPRYAYTKGMTLADKVTSLRLILAPAFFVIYLLPHALPAGPAMDWTVPVLWVLFVLSELTDMADGQVARRRAEVSDFGKLFDPFADTLTQLTYFLCFVVDGIIPAGLYLVVLYREYSILFVRNLMLKKGIAMGARITGKVKTVTYILAAALALLASSLLRLGFDGGLVSGVKTGARAAFLLSVILSVLSFMDYLSVYRKTGKTPGKPGIPAGDPAGRVD